MHADSVQAPAAAIAVLRAPLAMLERERVQGILVGDHGIAWSIYRHDPDGVPGGASVTPAAEA